MCGFFRRKKAQSTLEYALIVAGCVGALLAMNAYTKRAVQGRVRSAIDDIGEQYSAGKVTSKYQTSHEETVTTERLGTVTNYDGALSDAMEDSYRGVSRYEVKSAGIVTKETLEGQGEKITQDFTDETLFPAVSTKD